VNDWTWTLTSVPVRERLAPSFYGFFREGGGVVGFAWRSARGWELRFRGANGGWMILCAPAGTLKKAEETLGIYLDQVRAAVIKRQQQAVAS